jgi:RHS repeat-associated protein
MRDGAGAALVYLHGDNLGSASLATSVAGTVLSQQRYAPYGEVRWSSGSMPTDFTFTGQRSGPPGYVGSLTDYVARFYSPALGRFVSADTIVPRPGDPQAYNRYTYVRNAPLHRIDPSGHDDGVSEFLSLFIGALDGWAEATLVGASGLGQQYDALSVSNEYFAVGRVVGNVAAMLTGWAEAETGAGAVAGGLAAGPETAGLSFAAVAAGGAFVAHGVTTIAAGATLALANTQKVRGGSGGVDSDGAEAAKRRVQDLEAKYGSNETHGLRRHGAGTTLAQQEYRAKTGYTPDGVGGDPTNATRFLDNKYLAEAYEAARKGWTPGTKFLPVEFTQDVAEGYYAGGRVYGKTHNVLVRFNADGTLLTAYGVLP